MSFGETSPPVVRHLLVCRRISYDLNAPGAAYTLHALITQLQLEAGAEFPVVVPELWAFLQVFGEVGEYEIWIELAAVDGEGEVLGEATSYGPLVLRVPDGVWVVNRAYRLANARLLRFGLHEVRVWCGADLLAREEFVV